MSIFFGPGLPSDDEPVRLGEILAGLDLPRRKHLAHVDIGVDEEGDLTLLVTCGCTRLTEYTLPDWPVSDLPHEIGLTCTGCWSSHWLRLS